MKTLVLLLAGLAGWGISLWSEESLVLRLLGFAPAVAVPLGMGLTLPRSDWREAILYSSALAGIMACLTSSVAGSCPWLLSALAGLIAVRERLLRMAY